MDIGEAVNVALISAGSEKDPTCSKKDEDPKWKSRVNKCNSQETATGQRLYENMWNNKAAHEKAELGVVPEKIAGKAWRLDDVRPTSFPVQAHHLIPKNYLPDHQVCTWLAINYTDNPDYQLRYDSNYDTDDHRNGYCLPYATPMKEWGGGQDHKTWVAFEVMERTGGLQLHQGSHATVLDKAKLETLAGKPIVPDITDTDGASDTDDYELSTIHEPGYLSRVGLLLNLVDDKALAHVEECDICQAQKSGDKISVLPMQGVTDLMHRVSKIIKILCAANAAHVSGYAYFYAYNKADIMVVNGKLWTKTSRDQLLAALT
jgi:hypothetical protein